MQRDLLPLIEGTTVSTKHGPVKSDHILFIASGAFHVAKPSDLLPELQGRLPIRVELKALTRDDLRRILTEPEANLIRQHQALMATEGVTLTFTEEAIDADRRRRGGGEQRGPRTSAPAASRPCSRRWWRRSASPPATGRAGRWRSPPSWCARRSASWRRTPTSAGSSYSVRRLDRSAAPGLASHPCSSSPALAAFALLAASPAARAEIAPALAARIDAAVEATLKATDTPSASVALVQDGKLAYARAYGLARISPAKPATAATRYQIASVSKEFTAAAALLLQEDGKLSLDDKVSKWFPDLTDADKVSLRQLLTHTSGYSDYWPQDYVLERFTHPDDPPRDHGRVGQTPAGLQAPGVDWQYSNTGYVIAGQIIEKAAGEPLFAFLKRRVFTPLKMTVADTDAAAPELEAGDATGYGKAALGPNRPAPLMGANWLYAAGEMATTAADVAKWDASLINRSLLKPASYELELTPYKLNGGRDSGYALGLFVSEKGGRKLIEHSGEGAGFTAENRIYPDDKVAVVTAVNSFSSSGASDIADAVANLVLTPKGPEAQARRAFAALQKGAPLKAEMTEQCALYFDAKTIGDYASTLGPLGEPTSFGERGHSLRGGMDIYTYRVRAGAKTLRVSVFVTKDGKIDQFLVYEVV